MRRYLSAFIVLIFALIWALTVATGGRLVEKTWRKNAAMLRQCLSAPVVSGPTTKTSSAAPDDPIPRMPAVTMAVVGEKLTLYSDGLLLARDTSRYKIKLAIDGMGAEQHPRYWAIIPTSADIGDHTMRVSVSDWDDKPLGESSSILRIVPDKVPAYSAAHPLNILIVGDSVIHQSMIPNMLYRKLSPLAEGHLRFVGTHQPGKSELTYYEAALPGVHHEGYGGWTWQMFMSHYKPGEEKLYKIPQSPFLFVEDGKPTLDVKRYLDERKLQGPLDAAIFMLGVNDTFSIDPSKPQSAREQIDAVLSTADSLLQAFRNTSPDTYLLLILPPYFTPSYAVFERQYGASGAYFADAWRQRAVVRMLNQAMIDHYDGKDPHIILVPTNAVLDTIDGYDPINPSHPNAYGNRSLTEALYGTLVATLQHAEGN